VQTAALRLLVKSSYSSSAFTPSLFVQTATVPIFEDLQVRPFYYISVPCITLMFLVLHLASQQCKNCPIYYVWHHNTVYTVPLLYFTSQYATTTILLHMHTVGGAGAPGPAGQPPRLCRGRERRALEASKGARRDGGKAEGRDGGSGGSARLDQGAEAAAEQKWEKSID
jgi:hypothetical protein